MTGHIDHDNMLCYTHVPTWQNIPVAVLLFLCCRLVRQVHRVRRHSLHNRHIGSATVHSTINKGCDIMLGYAKVVRM